ncbi:MobA/MobL family protein [Xanthomonas campestris]|uniref:MobA/MobL family protein n=1 Tax=Xanthomonas campestris pv. papavericola TaxID=487881 RepID=A0AAJ2X1N5_XANCA|nr:MobA/MobL family protein [Xanthomonas campestris]MEC3887139.1 MobA/MobL family protein [Xanthomonas campestris pv. papavericola]
MSSLHFGIRSGKHGAAADHMAYINREGCYAARGDLVATGHGNMPAFAKDKPLLLWKASDRYERKNGSTFRSFTISLPNVLTVDQLKDLAWNEARRLAGPKPFQFALHMPLSSLQAELNPHIHIVICDRLPDGIERPPEQMFRRHNPANPEKGGCRKDSGGKTPLALRNQVIAQRKAAADEINAALAKHGHDLRVEHRTLREQGIQRAPERYLGPARIRKMTSTERASYVEKQRGNRGVHDSATRTEQGR